MRSSPNRLLAVVLGGAYVLFGIVGLLVTTGAAFFADPGRSVLGIFSTNPAGSLLEILIGAALAMAGLSTVAAAKVVMTIAGTAFLVLGLLGLFLIGTGFNVLALNAAADVLLFASSVVLLAVGLGAERTVKATLPS